MPQMSPMLWLNLYGMFTITLVIFISMFFYIKTPKISLGSTSPTPSQKLNWKW